MVIFCPGSPSTEIDFLHLGHRIDWVTIVDSAPPSMEDICYGKYLILLEYKSIEK